MLTCTLGFHYFTSLPAVLQGWIVIHLRKTAPFQKTLIKLFLRIKECLTRPAAYQDCTWQIWMVDILIVLSRAARNKMLFHLFVELRGPLWCKTLPWKRAKVLFPFLFHWYVFTHPIEFTKESSGLGLLLFNFVCRGSK